MENLIRISRKFCEEIVERELNRARIDVVHWEKSKGEVSCSITGKLGNFTFERACSEWIVKGRVPLAVAQELYADPVGKTDVRVRGQYDSPPKAWVEWIAKDGREVFPEKEEKKFKGFIKKGILRLSESEKNKYIFSDDPKSVGAEAFITVYHIDTEVGLRLFADTLKKHGLV